MTQANSAARTAVAPPDHSKANKAIGRRNLRNGLIFIAPNFIGFLVLILIPVIQLFYIGFSKWSAFGDPKFNGLTNWVRLTHDSNFKASFINTIVYSVVHIPLTLAIAFALAVLLNTNLKGRAFFRTVAFFPYITSIVAAAQVWNMLFDAKSGVINQIIKIFTGGWAPAWMGSTKWAMVAVIIVATWREVGYFMILILAGLQTIPRRTVRGRIHRRRERLAAVLEDHRPVHASDPVLRARHPYHPVLQDP
ncbi:sugar ABC transporter permease [Bifidobacterium amazonense]|uniref:Sugar ABC transporter permease n=1 Tax=Bifidobacterium amazonense TaxID=2809027 RepID=A0ABS9VX66_9BIFI|nr:sugar ABC transporter permease [Bifidobacterium amazonense]